MCTLSSSLGKKRPSCCRLWTAWTFCLAWTCFRAFSLSLRAFRLKTSFVTCYTLSSQFCLCQGLFIGIVLTSLLFIFICSRLIRLPWKLFTSVLNKWEQTCKNLCLCVQREGAGVNTGFTKFYQDPHILIQAFLAMEIWQDFSLAEWFYLGKTPCLGAASIALIHTITRLGVLDKNPLLERESNPT